MCCNLERRIVNLLEHNTTSTINHHQAQRSGIDSLVGGYATIDWDFREQCRFAVVDFPCLVLNLMSSCIVVPWMDRLRLVDGWTRDRQCLWNVSIIADSFVWSKV